MTSPMMRRIAQASGIDEATCVRVCKALGTILQESAGGSIGSDQIGRFEVAAVQKRFGRNPMTGQAIAIPPSGKLNIVFKPAEMIPGIDTVSPALAIPEMLLRPVSDAMTEDSSVASHKIGGDPDWLQGREESLVCCRREMSFYGQLASIGGEFDLADNGMIYVFVCYTCWNTRSMMQFD